MSSYNQGSKSPLTEQAYKFNFSLFHPSASAGTHLPCRHLNIVTFSKHCATWMQTLANIFYHCLKHIRSLRCHFSRFIQKIQPPLPSSSWFCLCTDLQCFFFSLLWPSLAANILTFCIVFLHYLQFSKHSGKRGKYMQQNTDREHCISAFLRGNVYENGLCEVFMLSLEW